jgi:hypothetical protein
MPQEENECSKLVRSAIPVSETTTESVATVTMNDVTEDTHKFDNRRLAMSCDLIPDPTQ